MSEENISVNKFKPVGSLEFTDFKLRGVKASLALARLKEWGIANTGIENSRDFTFARIKETGQVMDQSNLIAIFNRAIDRMTNPEEKKLCQNMMGEMFGALTGNKPDFTDGGKLNFEQAEEKRLKYQDTIRESLNTASKLAFNEIMKHPDLTNEFLREQISFDSNKMDKIEEIEKLKVKAIEECLMSLGKKANDMESLSPEDVQNLIYNIALEPANLVDYENFFPSTGN
jgi:hypothetical protein